MAIIKTGEYEVVETGAVQILSTADTIITFQDISLLFSFETDEKGEMGIQLRSDPDANNRLRFVLMNITTQSYGTTDFTKFGTLTDGKDIYISFRVSSLNDKRIWSLEYTICKK